MLNAPLPLVSMSWSRLLLLIFVLSFVLSSLVSLMMIDDGDEWAAAGDRQHAALFIAHSQLPPHLQQQTASSHHAHHKQQQPQHHSISSSAGGDALHGGGNAGQQAAAGADGGGGGDGDGEGDAEAAQGLSLSPLLFSGLAADEAAIEAMEQRVREAKAAQQKTAETAAAASAAAAPPPSQFASHALVLSNLTQDCMAHIALLPSAALPAVSSLPSSLPAASSVLSLVLVQHWTASASPLPPLTSSLSRYTRPANSFFLSSPPSSRHVVTDDWSAAFSQPVPGLVSHFAVSSSHDWTAVAYTQHSPPHDYSLHLRVLHERGGEQQTVDALLTGHQPVSGLTLTVSNDSSSCRLLVSRRMDDRTFRAWEARAVDGQPLTLQQAEDGPAVSESASAAASGREVLRLLHYAERADSEGVVVIESDERGNSQSPFVAAIYTRIAEQDSGDGSSQSSAAGSADRAQLLQLSDSISKEGLTAAATTGAGSNGSLAINSSEAVSATLSGSSVLSFPPSPSSSVWQLTSTLPRYRSMATLHPIPASALVTASSLSHRFLAYSCTPFLTAVDASHQFVPIEIIHLQPSTVFSHLAVSAAGRVIALVDQQRDVILLRRTAAAAHRHRHALPSFPSSPSAPPSAPPELRSQWEVALELILPHLLRRLQVVSAQLLTLDRRTEAERETEAESAAAAEEAAAAAPAGSRDSLYLCLLFEGGVVASFALDVPEHELLLTAAAADSSSSSAHSVDGSVLGSLSVSGLGSGVEVLAELLLLNWELIIGLAVIAFSAAFSLQMSSITRAWQQQTPTR